MEIERRVKQRYGAGHGFSTDGRPSEVQAEEHREIAVAHLHQELLPLLTPGFCPAKREATLGLRGLDLAEAAEMSAGPSPTCGTNGSPPRSTVSFGYLRGRLVAVVWTPAEGGRRVISMRKANDREQRRYG